MRTFRDRYTNLDRCQWVRTEARDQLSSLDVETAEELLGLLRIDGLRPLVARSAGVEPAVLDQWEREAADVVRSVHGEGYLAPLSENELARFSCGLRVGDEFGHDSSPSVGNPAWSGGANLTRGFPHGIKSQGSRGTCVAFASTAVAEYLVRGEPLSEQWLYYCCKRRDGIPNTSGTYISTAAHCLQVDGICTARTWPYNPSRGRTEGQGPPPPGAAADARRHQSRRTISVGVQSIPAVLAGSDLKARPIIGGFEVYPSWHRNPVTRRTGYIRLPLPGESRSGGHAMTIAYCDDQNVGGRNSWGTGWGSESPLGSGHFTMSWEYIRRHGHGHSTCVFAAESALSLVKGSGGVAAGVAAAAIAVLLGGGTPALREAVATGQLEPQAQVVEQRAVPTRHQIARGETLRAIAAWLGVPLRRLQIANSIIGPELQAYDWIEIPEGPLPQQVEWVVRRGHTLWSISRVTGCPVGRLIEVNGLASSSLVPGMVLVVPLGGEVR